MSVHQQPQSDAAQDATLTGSAGTVRAMPQTPQQFLTPEQKARFRSLAKGVGHTASEIGHAGGAIVDKLGRKWDPKLHPRDSRGRFIETGGTARLWGGGTAKVVRILGNGKIEVQKPDGKRERVKANRLTMIARPDGSKPTDSREKVLGEDARRHADPKRGDGLSADDHGDQDHDGIPDAQDLDADGNGVRDDADKRAGHKAPKKAPHAAPKKADPRAQETEALREHYRQGSPGEQLDHMQELFNRNTLAEDQTLEAQGNGLAIRRSGSRTWQVFHANTGASLGADNVTSKEQARQLAARLGEIHDAEGNRFDWKSPGVHERFATFRDRSGEGLEAAVTRAEAEHHLSLGEKGESHRKVTMARGRGLVDQPNPHQDVLNQQDDLTQRLIRQNADALGQPTPNVAPIPQAPEQPATPQAVQDLASVEEQAKRDGDLVLFHGGLPEGTGLDGIDLNRNGAQQNKRGRSFGGFYLADDSERSKAWAEDYAKKRNGNLTGFAISKDARIHETDDVIDRLSAEDRAKLAEKYDLVKGRDSLGRTQYVLLNKDVVRGIGEHNLNGDQPNQHDAPNAPETPAEPFGHMNELMAATKATQGDVHAELGRQHSINGRTDDLEQRQRVADMFSKAREQAPTRSPEELDRYLSDLAANVRSVAEGLDDSDPRQREAKTKALEVADRIDAHRARVDATARKARAGKHHDQHAGAGDQQGHTAPDTTTPEGTNGDGSALREDRGGVLADVPAEQGGGDQRPDELLRSDGTAGAGRDARGGGRDTAAPDEQQQRADRGEAGSDAGRGGTGAEGDRLPDAGAGDGDAQAARPRAARRGASRAVAGKGKPARKFRPTGQGDLAPKGEKAKLTANMEALRTLRKVQAEDRPATPQEQQVLARWAGWGALKGVFDPDDHRFDAEREELRGLLSPEEWELAKTNRLNAHYTDAALVQDVWGTLTSLGFDGGEVLEAGSGSGNFFGFAPEHAHMTGVEQDPITAGISKLLYPDADVWQESFGRTPINPGTFDAVVGNVPFGNFPVRDPKWNPKNRHSIHDHFLIKEMDALKPGGVMAVISSQFTLNGQNDEARRKLYAQGDLIGAVRLPAKAHSEAAGTDVVTDLLLFRKRKPGEKPGDDSWLKAVPATHPDGSPVLGIAKKGEEPKQQLTNGYFAEHPENVLGTMKDGGYNGIAVEPDGEWAGRLKQTLAGIAQQARKDGRGYAPMTDVSKPRRLSGSEREGSMSFAGVGKDAKGRDRLNFEIIEDGRRVELPVPSTQQHELRSLLELRDLYQQLLDTETSTTADDDPDLLAARKRLERAYDAHVAQYGPITRYTPNEESGKKVKPPVMSIASQDEASALLYGLEHGYDPATGTVKKADVFTKRQTDVSRQIAEHTSDPREAVDLAFEKDGKLDLATVARMLQMRPAQAREAIRPHVFENPAKPGELLRREEYLSGYTRQKLAEARAAAETDPRFAENVKALEEVVPADATLADVPLVLGSTYIDPRLITAFARHLMGRGSSVEVVRDKEDGSWKVPTPKDRYGRNAVLENETWGTADRSFYKLLEAVIKQQHHNIVVRKKDSEGNSYVDKKAGEDATAKAEEIADAFVDWVWSDSKHSEPIVKAYTEKFRAITPRSYDGSRTRELPGASKSIHLRQHQNDAIARAVAEPSVLLDHAVGAGKTFELAGVAMELKRLGLARKPVLTVPSPLIEAWVSDFRKLYPNARILAGDSDTLSRSGGAKARKRFAAMAQASDWDVVILTHEAFESIPVERDTEQKYLSRQLAALESQLRKAKAEKAGKRAEAAIQTKIEKAKAKIEEQLARRQDDDGITFEKLGFDYVLVDEAHKFKNLSFNTLIDGVQPPEGSGRARDMHMKLDMLRERAGDSPNARVAAFATGTPISNSLAEMYTMTRFLRPDLLKDAGIEDFDSWAAAFAQVSAKLEVDTAANSLVSKTRLRGFTDALGDALRIWRTFTDTKTHEDLNLPRPALKGGQRQVHVTEMTPEQRRVMGSFIHRVDAIPPGKPEKGQDTHVAIIGDGRRAAVDPRLISARGKEWAGITGDEDFHNPKIAEAADTIAAIHREHADRQFKVKHDSDEIAPEKGAAQLVMLDADSPKKDRFSAYQLLKDELVARGIPADKIRFIQEARNSDEKQRMIDDANQGRIAVLMGSTEALGTGTNVQNRLAALHHLDGSWKPSDIEQREGRILRQGNQFPEVEIHAYITKGTHDQKVWDMTSYKQGVLSAIAAGDYDMRAVEFQDDVDPLKDFDTLVGAASVDPLVADHREVEAEVKKLERLANSHRNSIKNAESTVRNNQQLVKHLEQQLGELREARSLVQDTSGDKFKVSLGNSRYSQQEYTSRKEAASFLADAARVAMDRHYQSGEQNHGVIGTIGGFQIALTTKKVPGTGNSVILSLRHPNRDYSDLPMQRVVTTVSELDSNGSGVIARLENVQATGVDRAIKTRMDEIEHKTAETEAAAAQALAPFKREKDLEQARRRKALLDQVFNEAVPESEKAGLRQEYEGIAEEARAKAEKEKAERIAALNAAGEKKKPKPVPGGAPTKAERADAEQRMEVDEQQVRDDLARIGADPEKAGSSAERPQDATEQPAAAEETPAVPQEPQEPAQAPEAPAESDATPEQPAGQDWGGMRPSDFDSSQDPSLLTEDQVRTEQPTSRPDDEHGTPDMFDAADAAQPAEEAQPDAAAEPTPTEEPTAAPAEPVDLTALSDDDLAARVAGAADLSPEERRAALDEMKRRMDAALSKRPEEGESSPAEPLPPKPEAGNGLLGFLSELAGPREHGDNAHLGLGNQQRLADALDKGYVEPWGNPEDHQYRLTDAGWEQLRKLNARDDAAGTKRSSRKPLPGEDGYREPVGPAEAPAAPETPAAEQAPAAPEAPTSAERTASKVRVDRAGSVFATIDGQEVRLGSVTKLDKYETGTSEREYRATPGAAGRASRKNSARGFSTRQAAVDWLLKDAKVTRASSEEPKAGEPNAPEAPAAPADGIRQGEVGMKLGAGEQVLTASGRTTTPFPKVDTSTPRKTDATLRRIDAWLHENAKAEIAHRGLIDTLPEDPKEMSQADKDTAEHVLFDPEWYSPDQKPRSILKPLTPREEPRAAEEPTAPEKPAEATPEAPATPEPTPAEITDEPSWNEDGEENPYNEDADSEDGFGGTDGTEGIDGPDAGAAPSLAQWEEQGYQVEKRGKTVYFTADSPDKFTDQPKDLEFEQYQRDKLAEANANFEAPEGYTEVAFDDLRPGDLVQSADDASGPRLVLSRERQPDGSVVVRTVHGDESGKVRHPKGQGVRQLTDGQRIARKDDTSAGHALWEQYANLKGGEYAGAMQPIGEEEPEIAEVHGLDGDYSTVMRYEDLRPGMRVAGLSYGPKPKWNDKPKPVQGRVRDFTSKHYLDAAPDARPSRHFEANLEDENGHFVGELFRRGFVAVHKDDAPEGYNLNQHRDGEQRDESIVDLPNEPEHVAEEHERDRERDDERNRRHDRNGRNGNGGDGPGAPNGTDLPGDGQQDDNQDDEHADDHQDEGRDEPFLTEEERRRRRRRRNRNNHGGGHGGPGLPNGGMPHLPSSSDNSGTGGDAPNPHAAAAKHIADDRQRFRAELRHRLLHPLAQFDATAQHEAARIEDPAKRQAFEKAAAEARDTAQQFGDQLTEDYLGQIADAATPAEAEAAYYGGKNKLGKGTGRGGIQQGDSLHALDDQLAAQVEQLRATAGDDAAAALERALGKDDAPAARPKGADDGPSYEVTRAVWGPATSAAYEAMRAKVGPDAGDRQRAEGNAELDHLLGEQPAATTEAPAAEDFTPEPAQAPQIPEPAPGLPTSREGWGLPAKPKRRIPESARRRGVPETAEPVAPEKLHVGDTVWLKKADGEHGPVTVESTSFDGRHVRVVGTDENGKRTTGLIPDHAEAYRTAAAPEGAPEAMGQPVQASEAGGPILPGDLRPGDVFEGRMPTGASTDKVKRQLRVTGPAVKRGFMHEVPVEDTRTGERGLSKVPSSRPVMVSERGAAPEAPASAPTVEQQAPAAAVDHPLPDALPKARNALMDALVRAAQGEPNARTAALRFAANALLEGHKFGAPADLGHAAYEKPKAKAGDRWPQVRDQLAAAVDQIGQLADELAARGIDTRLSPARKGERGPALPDFLRDYARGFQEAARADKAAPNAPETAKEAAQDAAPQAPEWTKSPLGITAKAGDWTAHVRPTWGGKHEWEVSLGDKRGHGTADSEDAAKRAIGNQIDAWRNSGLTSTPAPVDARRPDEAPLPGQAPDAPAEAPEPINGQGAEWVRAADLMPGDTARMDGTDMRGRPASAAGYVQGSEPVRITTGRRSRQGIAVTLTENQDGSGWRQVVVAKADGIAARATNGTLANPEADGAPESLPEQQVLTGDLPERLPVDQGGVGIFPGSLVDDQSKTGVVTEAASDLVTVRWDDGKTEQVRGDQLSVTDNGAARPDGWTASGVKAKPGLVVETGKGRGVVESVDGDRANVLTPKGTKVVPVASMRVVGEVQPDGPKAPTAAQPVHATEKPAGELAQGDVFLLDGQPVKVEGVSGDLHHRTVDYSTADGRRGTVEMDAAEVMQLVDGATPSPAAATPAEIEPLRPLPLDPIEGPEVHPRLTTGQRGAINQLGLDMAEGSADPQVAQAAARIREERALSIEQTRALADELRSAAEQTDSASLRRSLTSAADRLDKAGRGASGEPTLFARPVTEDGPADAVTPDQVGAGDEVWVPKGPKHAVQGTVVDAVDDGTGIWLLTLDRDGHREVHPVAADDVVYRAPGRSNAEPAEQPQIPAEDPAELEDRMVAPEVQERMEDTAQGVVENAAEAAVDAESIHEAREAAAQALADEEVQAEKERVADEFYDAAPDGEQRGDALGWGDLAADDAVEQAREEAVNVINDVEPLPGESEQDTIDRMIDALLDVPAGLDLDAEKHRPAEAPAALNGGSNGGSPTDQARDGLTVDDLLAPPAKPGRPAAERRAEVAKHIEDEVASVEAALFALMDEVGDGSGYTDAELDALIRKRLGAPNSERGRRAASIVAAALGEEVRPGSVAAASSLLSRIRGRVADAGRKAITDWKARGGSLRRSLLDRMRSVRTSMPSWPEYRRLMRMAGPDEGGNGGGTPAPGAPDAPTGLAAQVAQAAAGLPEVGRFGQVKQRGRFLGGISLADLKSGRPLRRTPGERWALDRAADDGPGATALGHLDAVRAAGDTVDQAMTGRMAELLPGLGVDPHAAVRDSKQRMLDAERAERAAFAVGQGVDEARAAARQAREQHEKLRKQYAAALSQAAVETLRQVRPMGADGEARLGIKGDRRSTAALRWAEQFIPTDWLDAAKAETITARISDRGYFVAESGEMGLADAGDTAEMVPGASHYGQVALHELAHFFEGALPDLTDAEWAYYWRRTSSGPVGARKRRGSNRQVSMADRFPGAGFEPHEVTREDSFADPYVGVETDQGKHYELLATSFESLFGGSDYLDDDLRKATMGLLATLALQKREGWAPTP